MNLILSPADSLCNVDVDYNSKLHLPTSLQHDPTGFVRVGLVLQIWHIRGTPSATIPAISQQPRPVST